MLIYMALFFLIGFIPIVQNYRNNQYGVQLSVAPSRYIIKKTKPHHPHVFYCVVISIVLNSLVVFAA